MQKPGRPEVVKTTRLLQIGKLNGDRKMGWQAVVLVGLFCLAFQYIPCFLAAAQSSKTHLLKGT